MKNATTGNIGPIFQQGRRLSMLKFSLGARKRVIPKLLRNRIFRTFIGWILRPSLTRVSLLQLLCTLLGSKPLHACFSVCDRAHNIIAKTANRCPRSSLCLCLIWTQSSISGTLTCTFFHALCVCLLDVENSAHMFPHLYPHTRSNREDSRSRDECDRHSLAFAQTVRGEFAGCGVTPVTASSTDGKRNVSGSYVPKLDNLELHNSAFGGQISGMNVFLMTLESCVKQTMW